MNYPFGMLEPNRQFNAGKYRFGFDGQEMDNDMSGFANLLTAEYWEYDTRIGRRWNLDPMMSTYAWQSPYAAFNDNPIATVDPEGLEGKNPPSDYKVKQGDNLTAIAKKTGSSLSDIYKANPGLEDHKNLIHPGDIIKIPSSNSKTNSPSKISASKENAYSWSPTNSVTGAGGQATTAGASVKGKKEGGIMWTSKMGQGQEDKQSAKPDFMQSIDDVLENILNIFDWEEKAAEDLGSGMQRTPQWYDDYEKVESAKDAIENGKKLGEMIHSTISSKHETSQSHPAPAQTYYWWEYSTPNNEDSVIHWYNPTTKKGYFQTIKRNK